MIKYGILDNMDNIGNNIHVISNVRAGSLKYYEKCELEFANIVNETINQYLEEDLNE